MANQLAVRQLNDNEVRDQYLPLRQSVLAVELGWTELSGSSSIMRDEYDNDSFCYGVLWEENLLGAIRLVVKKSTRELPSGQYLPVDELFQEKCAELSRVIVDKPFRGHNLFSVLVLHATIEAVSIGAKHIYGTIVDTPGGKAFSRRHGYEIVGEPFFYRDGVIIVPSKTITVKLLPEQCRNIFEMSKRRNSLLKDITLWSPRINDK